MNLKKYYIDTSPLSGEAQEKAVLFIESNAWTSSWISGSNGCYQCYWEEFVDPSLFPQLAGCIVRELP